MLKLQRFFHDGFPRSNTRRKVDRVKQVKCEERSTKPYVPPMKDDMGIDLRCGDSSRNLSCGYSITSNRYEKYEDHRPLTPRENRCKRSITHRYEEARPITPKEHRQKRTFSRGSRNGTPTDRREDSKTLKELYSREMMPSSETLFDKTPSYEGSAASTNLSYHSRTPGDHIRSKSLRVGYKRKYNASNRIESNCPFDGSDYNAYDCFRGSPRNNYQCSGSSALTDGPRLDRWTARNSSRRKILNSGALGKCFCEYCMDVVTKRPPYCRNIPILKARTAASRRYHRRC